MVKVGWVELVWVVTELGYPPGTLQYYIGYTSHHFEISKVLEQPNNLHRLL